jgi:hypothetical protein
METRSNDKDSKLNDCGDPDGHVYSAQRSQESKNICKKTKRQRKSQQNSSIFAYYYLIQMYSIFSHTLSGVQQFSVVTNFVKVDRFQIYSRLLLAKCKRESLF